MVIGVDARSAYKQKKTGIGNYIGNLVNALLEVDKANTYVLYVDGDCQVPDYRSDNVTVRRLSYPFKSLWAEIRLQIDLLAFKPDVFYFTKYHRPFWCRIPSVTCIYDTTKIALKGVKTVDRIFYRFFTKLAIKNSSRVISISESTKNDIQKNFNVDPEKISVTPLSYDRGTFHARHCDADIDHARTKYGIKGEYILSVGTLSYHKNYQRLIAAYSRYTLECSAKQSLVIVGKKTVFYDTLLRMVDKYSLKENVLFLDFVDRDDLPLLYAGATYFVFPSLYEGFGLPVLEAMACGTPVVASKVSSIPEVAGDSAVFINPYQINNIAEKMMMVSSNADLRERFRAKGLDRVNSFTWLRTASQTVDILKASCGK